METNLEGAELNEAIARKLGWRWEECPECVCCWVGNEIPHLQAEWAASVDACIELFERKLRPKGWTATIMECPGYWRVHLWQRGTNNEPATELAALAFAFARAVLVALEVE